VNVLIKVLQDDKDEELLAALHDSLRALLASIEDPLAEGLNTLMPLHTTWMDNSRRIDASMASGDPLRSISSLLQGTGPRFVVVPHGLGPIADLPD